MQEWLKSNRTFHIMRDHPSHNGKNFSCQIYQSKHFGFLGYILAGLWGTKLDKNRREMVKNLAVNMLNSAPRNYWDFDQALLRRIVWPEAVKDSVQHDSYSCNYAKFNSFHSTKPFPTRRKNKLYVGWSPAKTNQTGIRPCPKQCRMDTSWIFC